MLRGYVECARDLSKAGRLLQRMEKEKQVEARPNVRTANTFLRGCLLLGAVQEAEALLQRMVTLWAQDEAWQRHGGSPDASSYELVVALKCQALRATEASLLAREAIKRLGASSGCGAMFCGCARAHLLLGQLEEARKDAKRARQLTEAGQQEEKLSSAWSASGFRGSWKVWWAVAASAAPRSGIAMRRLKRSRTAAMKGI